MTTNAPDRRRRAETLAARQVESTLAAYTAFLQSPAFQHNVDIAVLTKIAGDESVSHRERRLAAEALAKLRLQAMEALADLSGVRAQVLRDLGLDETPQATVALTQVNQRIEIVRKDDWRAATAKVVDVLPERSAESDGGGAE